MLYLVRCELRQNKFWRKLIPGLGLLNLLGHYEMGKLLTHPEKLVYDIRNVTITELFSDAWNLFRIGGNVESDDSDSYTALTIFTLETTYVLFLFLVFVHYVCVVVIKYFTASDFKSKREDVTDKTFHTLTQLIYPTTYKDWDECSSSGGDNNSSDIKSNWHQNCLEMKWMTALFALEHLVLCGPIFILASKILERNSLLESKFPLVWEEENSTTTSLSLSIAFPIFYIILPFIQYWLFDAFHKFGHPWSSILIAKIKEE